MTPPEKIREIACHNCCCSFEDKSKANCRHYNNVWQMYEWTLKQIAERASKWIDNNINYNTDDKVSRTKKEILRESLLKTIQL